MISLEYDDRPASVAFDVAIVAVGYERRCRWVTEQIGVEARFGLGLEFGFLAEGAYSHNRTFFEARSFRIINGLAHGGSSAIAEVINSAAADNGVVRIFVDISSMSREMIANVVLGIHGTRPELDIHVTTAYAPSKFTKSHGPAPIRVANPVKPALAGWSSRPEEPLGAIFGLGCEPGLALGALQYLEPDKAWTFSPRGIDPQFDGEMKKANVHIKDIFDVTDFEYEITSPTITRGRFEALLNAIDGDFRIITVPFGPKIFAWLTISTVVLTRRNRVGVWAFSSKDQAVLVDRDAEGPVVWHSIRVEKGGAITAR